MESFFTTVAWIGFVLFGVQAVGRSALHIWQSYTVSGQRDAICDKLQGRTIGRVIPMVVLTAVCAAWIWR